MALKPEAPWIKKDSVTGSVKFTEDIYVTEDIEGCETPESDEKRNDSDSYAANGADDKYSHSVPVFLKNNIFAQ